MIATLFSSSLFSQTNCQDARQKYWILYPDVANAKFDPYQHYQIHGKNEGRVWPACKGEEKDCENAKSQYYKLYPDLFNAGADAWTHYRTHGIKEGRVWPFCYSVSTSTLSVHSQSEVKIGNQIWMAKNLDVDRFRNGDVIPEVKSKKEWKKYGQLKKPAWCYYNNDPKNGNIYGKLYNWYAVNDNRGLAPVGYHIPSYEEWELLTPDDLEGSHVHLSNKNQTVSTKKKKKSGFNALLGGLRDHEGIFGWISKIAVWWSSTENGDFDAWFFYLDYKGYLLHDYGGEMNNMGDKSEGFSVRCIKD